MLDPANNRFLQRDLAEDDPSHKQIIPYAIFRFENKFLYYVRGGGSGEKRLASKGSIGIGGHINDVDFAASSLDKDTYTNGVEREIDEELNLTGGYTQEILGLINDDSNEVGQVHLGVVHLFTLESDQVTSGEDNIADLQFLTLEELEAKHDELETWSQICVEGLRQLWRDK
jgi:predicted NUDIX family phosphoesterase